MNTDREELSELILNNFLPGDAVGSSWRLNPSAAADDIQAAGYRKLEPVWAETLKNDGEYEYTISSDCDGSNIKHWRRRPEMVATQPPSTWEQIA